MLKESLLAAAMSFPAWHGDKEGEDDRKARLAVIAQAIDEAVALATCRKIVEEEPPKREQRPHQAAEGGPKKDEHEGCRLLWRYDPRELGFLLLSQAFFETRLALHVHEGNCRVEIGECDGGRAIGLWQLQAGYHLPVEKWETLAGTDLESTRAAALEAARILGRGRNYCGSMEGAIASYATGSRCSWKHSDMRARYTRSLLYKY